MVLFSNSTLRSCLDSHHSIIDHIHNLQQKTSNFLFSLFLFCIDGSVTGEGRKRKRKKKKKSLQLSVDLLNFSRRVLHSSASSNIRAQWVRNVYKVNKRTDAVKVNLK